MPVLKFTYGYEVGVATGAICIDSSHIWDIQRETFMQKA